MMQTSILFRAIQLAITFSQGPKSEDVVGHRHKPKLGKAYSTVKLVKKMVVTK